MKGSKRILGLAVFETAIVLVVLAAILLGTAGTIRAPGLWVYLIVTALLYYLSLAMIYMKSPDLIQERLKPGAGEQDKVSIAAFLVVLPLHYAIAGLDVGRFHWSGNIPWWLQIMGLIGYVAGFAFVLWPMLVNPYFSSAVRIQADRGQHVITSGPYQFVRHPGYAGGLVFVLSSGIALGSWVSVLPMLLMIPLLVRRAIIEERMLEGGLPGYAEYKEQVRYRLIPGVW